MTGNNKVSITFHSDSQFSKCSRLEAFGSHHVDTLQLVVHVYVSSVIRCAVRSIVKTAILLPEAHGNSC